MEKIDEDLLFIPCRYYNNFNDNIKINDLIISYLKDEEFLSKFLTSNELLFLKKNINNKIEINSISYELETTGLLIREDNYFIVKDEFKEFILNNLNYYFNNKKDCDNKLHDYYIALGIIRHEIFISKKRFDSLVKKYNLNIDLKSANLLTRYCSFSNESKICTFHEIVYEYSTIRVKLAKSRKELKLNEYYDLGLNILPTFTDEYNRCLSSSFKVAFFFNKINKSDVLYHLAFLNYTFEEYIDNDLINEYADESFDEIDDYFRTCASFIDFNESNAFLSPRETIKVSHYLNDLLVFLKERYNFDYDDEDDFVYKILKIDNFLKDNDYEPIDELINQVNYDFEFEEFLYSLKEITFGDYYLTRLSEDGLVYLDKETLKPFYSYAIAEQGFFFNKVRPSLYKIAFIPFKGKRIVLAEKELKKLTKKELSEIDSKL